MQTVAFQGERGAYSEAAALAYFGKTDATIPCTAFEDVFVRVESGQAEYGIIPIENSLAGSIHQNYDLLLRHALHIVGEKIFRVQHCLIAHAETAINDIRHVWSHPQALAQCEHYIKKIGASIEAAYDTAGSVKLLKECGRKDVAAIAARHAADIYNMKILAEGIEDDPVNFTRFLVLNRQPDAFTAPEHVQTGKQNKTSIVFSLRNMPGALFKALSVFALRDIDLTKIESRPIRGKAWEYSFYLDFAGHEAEPVSARALEHLREITIMMRVLGSYPKDNGSS